MNEADVARTLVRIAHQIIEKNHGVSDLCLVGIRTRGVPLAQRIAENIKNIEGTMPEVGALDITLHRDDLSIESDKPVINGTDINFNIEGKNVILVDDVIYTGRTVRAALDAVLLIGRPAKIQLAVMVDRGHRELPIRADYIGKSIPTSKKEVVSVKIAPIDDETGVELYQKD
jgi:pyrimidine operon attenuation protein/uracil phosphoribosyltransferase